MGVDLARKKVLITGANRGIGFGLAEGFLKAGAMVTIVALEEDVIEIAGQLSETYKREVQGIICDIAKLAQVDQMAGKVDKVDVLVNNAGTFEEDWGTLPSELDFADLKRTFDVNFFGPYRLTQLLVPIIKRSPQGRIVNISSDMGSLEGINDPNSLVYEVMGPAYQASKVSINSITALFAKELRDSNCKVNSASPGWCRTDMGTDSAPLTVEEGAATPVWLATLPQDGPTGKFFSSTRNKGKMEW